MSDIQQTNPLARKKAIWILIFGLTSGTVLISTYWYFEKDIYKWIEENIEFLINNPWLPTLFSLIVVSPLFYFSGYLFIYGHRAAQAERIPAPGYSVVRDTVIYIGTSAVIRGRIVQALSLVIIVISAMIPVFFWYVFSHITGNV